VSKDGALFQWAYLPRPRPETNGQADAGTDGEDMQWRIAERHYFLQNNANVTCAAYHGDSNLFVVGFSNGIFSIYEMPDFNQIQNLRFVLALPIPVQ